MAGSPVLHTAHAYLFGRYVNLNNPMPTNPHYEAVKKMIKPWCLRCGEVQQGLRGKKCSAWGETYSRHIWEVFDKMLSV